MTTAPPLTIVSFEELQQLGPETVAKLRAAFVGPAAYGIVGVRDVPGYAASRRDAFGSAVRLVHDSEGRERCASVRQTYPGWSGTPGRESHPLQSCFTHNIKEGVGSAPAIDPYYGTNVWPNEEMKRDFTALNAAMYPAALGVMRGCDAVLAAELGPLETGRMRLEDIANEGTTLAGRWIWYDSAFSRDDNLLEELAGEQPAGGQCGMPSTLPAPEQAQELHIYICIYIYTYHTHNYGSSPALPGKCCCSRVAC